MEYKAEGPTFLNQGFVRSAYENSIRGSEASLHEFLWRSWHVLEPETAFKDNWHIGYLCEYLEAVTAGEIKRLLINEPPRHSKSHCVTISWPVWSWIKDPALRYMYLSYDADLATEHSLKRRDLITSQWFQKRWAHAFQLRGDQNLKTHFENNRRGVMNSAPLRGSITGHGGDILVVDDPHSRKNMDNDDIIESDVSAYRVNVPQCVNDPETARIVVVCQQLNEKDLSNWLLRNEGSKWTHVLLEAEATSCRTYVFPRSGKTFVREMGEPLHGAYWSLEKLHDQIPVLGRRGYDAQYQQRPSAIQGGIVKRSWWRFYRMPWCPDPKGIMPTLPEAFDKEAQSWDMAFKDYTDSSFVAGQHWAAKGANRYLKAEIHEHMDFPSTCQKLLTWSQEKPAAHTKWIEDAANGPAVISTLRNTVGGLIPVSTKELGGGKVARLSAASVDIESGNVYLPDPDVPGFEWVRDFIDEVCKCQSEKSGLWDRADAMAQAILKMRTSSCSTQGIGVGVGRPITAGIMSEII